MPALRSKCENCGDVDLTHDDIRIVTVSNPDTSESSSQYRFRCPLGGEIVLKPAEPRVVHILMAAGVDVELITLNPQGLPEDNITLISAETDIMIDLNVGFEAEFASLADGLGNSGH